MAILNDLDKITKKIDKLINKTNSGKNSWTAGMFLHEIKTKSEYKKKKYTNFKSYLRNELNISETKAYAYINIYLTYKEDDIGELILVTHLIYLREQNENIRENLLINLKDLDKIKVYNQKNATKFDIKNSKSRNSNSVNTNQKYELRPDYDKDILTTGVNLLNSAEKKGIIVNKKLAKDALEFATELTHRNLEYLKLPNKVGQKLNSKYFITINELFKFEPVLEIGLVSLFCTMFHLLKNIKFKYNKSNNLKFNSIEYVRSIFPDAAIRCINENGQETLLFVEFELYSTNYLLHEHNKSDKECHLIITWINDLKKNKLNEFGQIIPPIISIKDVLETGTIKLF